MVSTFTNEQQKELRDIFINVIGEQIKANVEVAIGMEIAQQLQGAIELAIEKARGDVIKEIVARLLAVSIEEWKRGS